MSIEVESLGIYTINAMQSKVNYWIVFSIGLEVLSHYNRFPPLPYNLSKRNNSFRFSIRTNWPKNGVSLFQFADRLLFIEFPSIMYVFKIIISLFFRLLCLPNWVASLSCGGFYTFIHFHVGPIFVSTVAIKLGRGSSMARNI